MNENTENRAFPESDISEWKWSWHSEYLKWITAFANTDGGILHIGVNDDGYIVGLKNHRTLLESIPNQIRDKLHITPKVRLRSVEAAGTNIRYPEGVPDAIASKDINRYACGIFAPLSDKDKFKLARWKKELPVVRDPDGRFYYIEIVVEPYPDLVFCDGIAYTRSGSTLQILSGLELEKAVMKTAGRTWDSFPVAGKDISDLDHSAIDVLRTKSVNKKRLTPEEADSSDTKLMEGMGLLDVDGGLTRAAMMLFSNPERIITGSYIKIGYFAPTGAYGQNTINDIIYQDIVRGPLITQADKTMDILYTKYMKALISYEGIQRVESYMIPQDAMREIILNAITHKYYPSGNPIQIKVYDDHITVMNEGFWPFDRLNVDEVYDKEHSSYPINPLIAEGIYTAGDIETWGTGFNKIKSACRRYGCPLPVIEATGGSVTVVVHASQDYLKLLPENNSVKEISAGESVGSAGKTVTSAGETAGSAGKTVTSAGKPAISSVKNTESGGKSSASVENLVGSSVETVELSGINERQRQIIKMMENGRKYSAEEIGQIIGLKGSRTRELLKDLVDKRCLKSTSTTNGNRYIKEKQ